MTAQTEEAKIVGYCEACTCSVVRYRSRWSCQCQQSEGGVRRWRKGWQRWGERT